MVLDVITHQEKMAVWSESLVIIGAGCQENHGCSQSASVQINGFALSGPTFRLIVPILCQLIVTVLNCLAPGSAQPSPVLSC